MTEQTAIEAFPCAQCGAALRYDPESGALLCGHCGHRQPLDRPSERALAEALRELDYAAALRDQIAETEIETTRVVPCVACGAEVSFEDRKTAGLCPFCAAPLVTPPQDHRHFRPKALLPFLISAEAARGALERWLGSRWFAPDDLSGARTGRPLQGVYLPYWTFDADTMSDYQGQRGEIHHVERYVTVVKDGAKRRVRRRVPEVRWRPASGRVARRFDDVLVLASASLPPSLTQKLSAEGAFDLAGLVPYAPGYLAGFAAEAYQVDLEQGFASGRAVMDLAIRRDVRLDIGGDRQRIERVETRVSDVSFKHVLLPVWIAAYRYRGRVYRTLVNGRTGQVMGQRPYSTWRIALAVLAAAALIGAALWLFSTLEG